MKTDQERAESNESAEQLPTRREAMGRFAQYTAPIMLAMLLSEQAAAVTNLG